MLNKEQFVEANTIVSKIEDLLKEARQEYEKLPPEIQEAMLEYHNNNATLVYCLRWGSQAAEEIREDWHVVVSELQCHAEDIPANKTNKL